METEHIVETGTTEPTTRTTIIRDSDAPAKGGGGIWIGLLAILILGAVAFFVFGQMSEAEVAKDGAVAEAADAVGNAADNVSEAAGTVGAAVDEGVSEATN